MIPRPLRIAIFVIGCIVVVWLSLAPGDQTPLATVWDKAKHTAAYLTLTLAGALAFPRHIWRLVVTLFLFGVGIEIAQATMELGRQGDPADALANSLGIAAGVGLTLVIRELLKVKSRVAGE